MAEITISELPAKTSLLDSDLIVIDDGTQSYRVTGAQLREFLKVNFLSVGTVVWSQSALATDNPGRLPLWTGEYIASASTIYPDFYSWVKNKHPELCKTKEQYDLLAATEAGCPFFVVDEEEGSLRLPKLKAFIKNAGEDGITQGDAGLPNITGSFKAGVYNNVSGAFKVKQNQGGNGGYEDWNQASVYSFDASLSSPVYGNSDTVTPAHTTLYPWVFAYNAAVSASTAQAAEFQNAISGKADRDFGNVPENYDYVVERYDDEEGNWHEVWKSGRLRQGGVINVTNATSNQVINFTKPFANTNYSFSTVAISTAAVDSRYITEKKDARTTTNTTIIYTMARSWLAEGKGA